MAYLICVIIILILEAAGVGLAYTQSEKLIKSIEKGWYENESKQAQASWLFENTTKCCTFNDNETEMEIRFNNHYKCGFENHPKPVESCYTTITKYVDTAMHAIKVVCVILIAFEALLLMCAIYLAVCWDPDQVKEDAITYVN